MRINALVIVLRRDEARIVGTETGELPAYFQANVIQGPDAFVEVADGFEDYARAMKRKLLRELATQPVGFLPESFDKNSSSVLTVSWERLLKTHAEQ